MGSRDWGGAAAGSAWPPPLPWHLLLVGTSRGFGWTFGLTKGDRSSAICSLTGWGAAVPDPPREVAAAWQTHVQPNTLCSSLPVLQRSSSPSTAAAFRCEMRLPVRHPDGQSPKSSKIGKSAPEQREGEETLSRQRYRKGREAKSPWGTSCCHHGSCCQHHRDHGHRRRERDGAGGP